MTTILAMAKSLHLQVVAEGLETEAQRENLYRLGCDFAQGYLFSKPLPAEEMPELLEIALRPGPPGERLAPVIAL